MVGGDRDETGFAKNMKDAHFVAAPFEANFIAEIRGPHKVDHWLHPVLLNGSTGAVIERNS